MSKINIGWVLHPEIVLNLRGPKDTRAFYEDIANNMGIKNGELFLREPDRYEAPNNFSIRYRMYLAYLCRETKFKLYHFSKDFFEDLSNIKSDLEIPNIPEAINAYISFPKGYKFEGCYVVKPKDINNYFVILVKPTDLIGSLPVFSDLSSLKDALNEIEKAEYVPEALDPSCYVERKDYAFITKTILTCLIYLYSPESILEYIPTKFWMKNKQIKERLKSGKPYIEDVKLNVIYVNRNYMTPRIYGVDEFERCGHFRWQPYGKGRALRRLQWIRATICRPKNIREEE